MLETHNRSGLLLLWFYPGINSRQVMSGVLDGKILKSFAHSFYIYFLASQGSSRITEDPGRHILPFLPTIEFPAMRCLIRCWAIP